MYYTYQNLSSRDICNLLKILIWLNTPNQRSVHHDKVFTGGGMVIATVLLVAVVVLDSLDFVGFTQISALLELQF